MCVCVIVSDFHGIISAVQSCVEQQREIGGPRKLAYLLRKDTTSPDAVLMPLLPITSLQVLTRVQVKAYKARRAFVPK